MSELQLGLLGIGALVVVGVLAYNKLTGDIGRYGYRLEAFAGEFNAIHGCAVDSQNNLYLAEVSYTMRGRREDPPRTYKGLRRLKRVAS